MDNIYYKNYFPAKMDHARFITQYENTNDITHAIKNKGNMKNSYIYRTFLQNNAMTMINNERAYLANNFLPRSEIGVFVNKKQ